MQTGMLCTLGMQVSQLLCKALLTGCRSACILPCSANRLCMLLNELFKQRIKDILLPEMQTCTLCAGDKDRAPHCSGDSS